MVRKLVGFLAALAVLLCATELAALTWAPISDPDLIRTSDLIVVGKIVWVENGPASPAAVDKASILVQEVLRGDPTAVMATLSYPGRNRGVPTADGVESTLREWDILFDLNQEGVWFLKKDPAAPTGYVIDHPARFKPLFFKNKIAQAVADYAAR